MLPATFFYVQQSSNHWLNWPHICNFPKVWMHKLINTSALRCTSHTHTHTHTSVKSCTQPQLQFTPFHRFGPAALHTLTTYPILGDEAMGCWCRAWEPLALPMSPGPCPAPVRDTASAHPHFQLGCTCCSHIFFSDTTLLKNHWKDLVLCSPTWRISGSSMEVIQPLQLPANMLAFVQFECLTYLPHWSAIASI